MTADLLPCPFCGGEAETVTGPIPRKWGVRCINCDVWRDDRCESEGDAITAWNTRAALPARWVPDYTLAPHLQKIVDGAKAVPQWDTQADRLAPTLSAALAMPEVAAMVEALMDAESVLALSERPAFADPQHHADVTLLGRRIGFGALMSSASAAWRNDLLQKGYPAGGEYVAVPCHATVVKCLRKLRAALAALEGQSND